MTTSSPSSTESRRSPGKSLVGEVAARLGEMITTGMFKPGERLPPEHVLTEQLRVSRSVLREAVASLRVEGFVNSRRGSGVFVAQRLVDRPFRIAGGDVEAVPGIVQILELRAAVEIEAAGLAALRRTSEQAAAIRDALARIDSEGAGGGSASDADLAFHQAIAAATGNPHFGNFLIYLRGLVIPRERIRVETDPSLGSDAYLKMLQREHRKIEQAISVGDDVGARDAMRDHLLGSARRYERWAREAAS